MRFFYIVLITLVLCTSVDAETNRRVVLILDPYDNEQLLKIKAGILESAKWISFPEYKKRISPEQYDLSGAQSKLSNAKEAYEFLRFDESIKLLHGITEELKSYPATSEVLDVNREVLLYLALNYLAIDDTKGADKTIRDYVCISHGKALDPNIWPPNLIDTIDRREKSSRLTSITVATNPSGASIYIDSRKSGLSPLHSEIYPCMHFITISKHGYVTRTDKIISGGTFNFDLQPDLSAPSEQTLSKDNIKQILQTYNADGIVFVSLESKNPRTIKVSMVFTPDIDFTSTNFDYNNEDQAVKRVIDFLNHDESAETKQPILFKPLPLETQSSPQKNWYENKWLWGTGAAVAIAGIVYAITQTGRGHSSSSNGSVSIKW